MEKKNEKIFLPDICRSIILKLKGVSLQTYAMVVQNPNKTFMGISDLGRTNFLFFTVAHRENYDIYVIKLKFMMLWVS